VFTFGHVGREARVASDVAVLAHREVAASSIRIGQTPLLHVPEV
jgi:hypothetical protein